MFLLDTNAISNHLRGSYPKLSVRIDSTPRHQIWVSAVAVEEILRGRLEAIKNHREIADQIGARYEMLARSIRDLSHYQILPFDQAAAILFSGWPAQVLRHGRQDCRIAASAMAYNMTVVTADKDFSHIPGIKWEDWRG